MSNQYVLNDEGQPVKEPDLIKWAMWFSEADRSVAFTKVGESEISTVFLGLDHSFGGPPLLYETIVFGGELDGEENRYSTKEEALTGHREIVNKVLGKI